MSSKNTGPLCSPGAFTGLGKGKDMHPATGANTTVPGTAPKAAPIRSPLTPFKGGNMK